MEMGSRGFRLFKKSFLFVSPILLLQALLRPAVRDAVYLSLAAGTGSLKRSAATSAAAAPMSMLISLGALTAGEAEGFAFCELCLTRLLGVGIPDSELRI